MLYQLQFLREAQYHEKLITYGEAEKMNSVKKEKENKR